ncbi:MAG TPA: hypothetical protein VKX17_04095 [Planctomycetota bacterium]|nr:hypothetical protein [Planctomycetota bacterium]
MSARTVEGRPLAEINHDAMRLLYRELGPVEAVRFLRQFTRGLGDYTAERDATMGGKSVDQIVREIKRRRILKK